MRGSRPTSDLRSRSMWVVVTDNLFSQGIIGENLVSVFFAPPTSANDTNGELTFGSVDDSKTTGNVAFT